MDGADSRTAAAAADSSKAHQQVSGARIRFSSGCVWEYRRSVTRILTGAVGRGSVARNRQVRWAGRHEYRSTFFTGVREAPFEPFQTRQVGWGRVRNLAKGWA